MNMDASGDNFKESNYKNLLQEIEYLVSSSKKKFFRATTKLKYIKFPNLWRYLDCIF